MRTWYGYDNEGNIKSVESYSGGWDKTIDINSSDLQIAKSIRLDRAKESITKFASYNCNCQTSVCDCHNLISTEFFVVDGKIIEKPTTRLSVNGQLGIGRRALVSKIIELQLHGDNIENGYKVEYIIGSILGKERGQLEFNNSITDKLIVDVEARGRRVTIGFSGNKIRNHLVSAAC